MHNKQTSDRGVFPDRTSKSLATSETSVPHGSKETTKPNLATLSTESLEATQSRRSMYGFNLEGKLPALQFLSEGKINRQ
jgi:hypothetical protein